MSRRNQDNEYKQALIKRKNLEEEIEQKISDAIRSVEELITYSEKPKEHRAILKQLKSLLDSL